MNHDSASIQDFGMWEYSAFALFYIVIGFGLGRLRWYSVYRKLLRERPQRRARQAANQTARNPGQE